MTKEPILASSLAFSSIATKGAKTQFAENENGNLLAAILGGTIKAAESYSVVF